MFSTAPFLEKKRFAYYYICAISLGVAPVHAQAASGLSVTPFASVSSTKSIKPNKVGKKDDPEKESTETVVQRTTYGLRFDLRLTSYFGLNASVGTNKTDTTKKAVAARDEYNEIDYSKDANVDPNQQSATYRLVEEQRLGKVEALLQPRLGSVVTLKVGAGVRARQRLIDITDTQSETKSSIKAPITYHAVGVAGATLRLLRAFSAITEYRFYFLKFPKTEPHEQEVTVGFSVAI